MGDQPISTHTFRAIWPIVDQAVPYADLVHQAETEIPEIALRTHAFVMGRGRFAVAPSNRVPGSGNVTATVLVFEAPARETQPRPYHSRLTGRAS